MYKGQWRNSNNSSSNTGTNNVKIVTISAVTLTANRAFSSSFLNVQCNTHKIGKHSFYFFRGCCHVF